MFKLLAHSQKGQSVAFFVLLLPLLLIMPVLVLELGHLYIYKAELQHAKDAADAAWENGVKDKENSDEQKTLIEKLVSMNANRTRFDVTVEIPDPTSIEEGDFVLDSDTTATYKYNNDSEVSDPPPFNSNDTSFKELNNREFNRKYSSIDVTNESRSWLGKFIDRVAKGWNSLFHGGDPSGVYELESNETTTTTGTKIEYGTVIITQSGGSFDVVLKEEVKPIFKGVFDEDPFQTITFGESTSTETKEAWRLTALTKTDTTPMLYYYKDGKIFGSGEDTTRSAVKGQWVEGESRITYENPNP